MSGTFPAPPTAGELALLSRQLARQATLKSRGNSASGTQVYSSSIDCNHAVRIIAGDSASCVGQVQDPFAHLGEEKRLSIAEGTGGEENVETDDSIEYMITVRNADSGEEYVHPTPLKTLRHWHLHFLDAPIFRRLNIAKEPDFPCLTPPRGRNLWSSLTLEKSGTIFHVIVTIASLASLPVPSLYTDTVLLYLLSPRLPVDHATFTTTAQSSDQRRAVAVHHALLAIATEAGFQPCGTTHASDPSADSGAAEKKKSGGKDDDADDAGHSSGGTVARETLLHGDCVTLPDTCASSRLCGAFVSNTPESSAGAVILPLALKYVRFLLPALQSGHHTLTYDIVQPHRYAYIFQIRSIGGWQLLGAVNMYASSDAIQTQFQLRSLTPFDRQGASFLRPVSMAAPTTSDAITSAVNSLTQAQNAVRAQFNDAFVAWRGTVPSDTSAPFAEKRNASKPDINRATTDDQKRALPPSLYRPLIAYAGMSLLHEKMVANFQHATSVLQIQRGNRFIELWTGGRHQHAGSSNNGAALLSAELAAVIYEFCSGVAAAVMVELKQKIASLPSSSVSILPATARAKRKGGAATTTAAIFTGNAIGSYVMNVDASKLSDIVVPPHQMRSIMHSCRGTPPDRWYMHGCPALYESAIDLAQTLFHKPSVYASLVPPAVMSALIPSSISSTADHTAAAKHHHALQVVLDQARFQDKNIMRGYSSYDTFSLKMKNTDLNNSDRRYRRATQALAYALFTNDIGSRVPGWS